jgi:hypothetical protein
VSLEPESLYQNYPSRLALCCLGTWQASNCVCVQGEQLAEMETQLLCELGSSCG